MNDDDFLIQVIARRMDDECPWSKGATILKHADWVDVVTHLWHDKTLRAALMEAYQPEIEEAQAERNETMERASAYAEWKAESSLRAKDRERESDGMPL